MRNVYNTLYTESKIPKQYYHIFNVNKNLLKPTFII